MTDDDGLERLATLLDYAYRGIATLGGRCHVDREAGCHVCDALTAAEYMVGDLSDGPEWWVPKRGWRRFVYVVVDAARGWRR